MVDNLHNLFNIVGQYSFIFLMFISGYFLWCKNNLFLYYYVGIFFNTLLNSLLKSVIREPRPLVNKKLLNILTNHGNKKKLKLFNTYGMPSAHAQNVFYSLVFINLSLGDIWVNIGFTTIALITISQRVFYNHHTISQVLVGACIGSLLGYLVYYLAEKKLSKK